jgi:hypothetical protein
MELGNILNAKISAKVLTGAYIPFVMQNHIQHDLQQAQQAPSQQHFSAAAVAAAAAAAANPPYMNGRIKSETGSDRGASPHASDGPRYPGPPQPPPSVGAYPPMPGYGADMRYPSPSATSMGLPNPMMNGYNSNPQDPSAYGGQRPLPDTSQQPQQQAGSNVRVAPDNGPPKSFACSTCGKGFARRSDLARHGRKSLLHDLLQSANSSQNVSIVEFVPMSAIGQIAASNSFSDLL